MNLLEARYHPTKSRDEFVVVGHVLCEDTHAAIVDGDRGEHANVSRTLLSNLKYLILMSAPRPFEGLRALDSAFWSFVEVGRLTDVPQANDTQPRRPR